MQAACYAALSSAGEAAADSGLAAADGWQLYRLKLFFGFILVSCIIMCVKQ
jgi:hypothetical protein